MKLFYYDKTPGYTRSNTDTLIQKSLEKYCGGTLPQSFRLLRTENGKPYLEGNPLYIGVTHTEKLVIVAIDEEAFGIDCESSDRRTLKALRIAAKYFSKNEFDYIYPDARIDGGAEEALRFLEVWVKKEAYVKYLGTGLADISKCDIFSLEGTFEKVHYNNYIIYIYKPEKTGEKD